MPPASISTLKKNKSKINLSSFFLSKAPCQQKSFYALWKATDKYYSPCVLLMCGNYNSHDFQLTLSMGNPTQLHVINGGLANFIFQTYFHILTMYSISAFLIWCPSYVSRVYGNCNPNHQKRIRLLKADLHNFIVHIIQLFIHYIWYSTHRPSNGNNFF